MTNRFSKAIILGAARDVEKELPHTLRNIGHIAKLFPSVSFAFFENDSKDNTLALLQQWMQGREGRVLHEKNLHEGFRYRTQRVAYVRNRLHDFVRANAAKSDCVVIFDMDWSNRFVDLPGFARALSYLAEMKNLAGLFANTLPYYYDVYALRHDRWCPADCWRSVIEATAAGMPEDEARKKFVEAPSVYLPPNRQPIPVRSAFGGIGIYRTSAFLSARYEGATADGWECCEHVSFNLSLTRNTGLGLAVFPGLINSPYPWLGRLVRAPAKVTELACKAVSYATWRRIPETFAYGG